MAEDFLPKDQLPDCWDDEARMNVLFAPLRDKSVNPKDWESKLEFWRNLIYSYCVHNKVYTFTYQDLSKKFIKNGRSPACLAAVVEQMYKNAEIQPLHVFQEKPSDTWSGWVTNNFIKKPVVWSFTKLKETIVSPDVNVCYVHVGAVESDCNRLLDNIPTELKSRIVDLNSIAEIVKYENIEQLNILLHSLHCKGKLSMRILANKGNTIVLLKFHDVDNVKGITDRDIDIYTLEQSEKTLVSDIEKLEMQVMKLIKDAKNYISKNQRQSAKTCLRKKKEVERCIEKRANTLHNVQTLLSRVEDAHTDAQVLDSYKTALGRLRRTFSETGLTEESVSNTMLELEETLELHDDLQVYLNKQDVTVDGDLEKELADLLADDTKPTDETVKKVITDKEIDAIEDKLASVDIKLPSPPKTAVDETKILV